MKKLLLSIALVALMAAPAFAAVQNVKVSGDIDSTYINRDNFDLGLKNAQGQATGLFKQSAFITQTRLRVDADLSDNVSTTVGLINERAWGAETTGTTTANDTSVDLYLAYATLREFLYSPLTLVVGRQVFNYGNGLILGDGGVNNVATGPLGVVAADFTKRTSYDGVKAILDYKPLTIDLIYFKNNQTIVTGAIDNGVRSSSNVYGINANYQLGDAMNTVAEAYLFTRINGDHNVITATGAADKGDKLYVPGLRLSTNPVKGLNTQAEFAWQGGTHVEPATTGPTVGEADVKRSAFAAQAMASYTLPIYEKYKPSVNASYTYVSGDKNAAVNPNVDTTKTAKTYRAWDFFNENQGSGTIYNTLFNLTDMHILSAGASVNPLEDVTTSVAWSGLWSAQKGGPQNPLTVLQPDSAAGIVESTNSSRKLGNEYDVNANYAYTEDVTFGVSLGWFVPGQEFNKTNRTTASQALAHVLVNF